MTSPAEVRARIADCRSELSRAEGERAELKRDLLEAGRELREVLGCEAGGVSQAIADLRREIEDGTQEVSELLDALEEEVRG